MASVITNKGLALLAKLTQGKSLEITCAKTGAGTVNASLLEQQTGVTNQKQTMTIKGVRYPSDGMCALVLSVTNDGVSSTYSIMQIGIFANDPDEGEVLFSIWQTDVAAGINVPSESVIPGYNAELNYNIKYDQADSVNVTLDPSNTVSQAAMEAYVGNELSVTVQSLSSVFVPASHATDKSNPHGVTAEQVGTVPTGDIPNIHIWEKYSADPKGYTETSVSEAIVGTVSYETRSLYYSSDISIVDGKFSSEGFEIVSSSAIADFLVVKGKYVCTNPSFTTGFYRVPEDAVLTKVSSGISIRPAVQFSLNNSQQLGYVADKANNAYPTNGVHSDGYWYKYSGQLGETPYTYGTRDLAAGVSPLATGKLYFVYE